MAASGEPTVEKLSLQDQDSEDDEDDLGLNVSIKRKGATQQTNGLHAHLSSQIMIQFRDSLSLPPQWLLGFCDEPESEHSLLRHHFPSKVGGRPAWLNPLELPSAEQLQCAITRKPLDFLLQIYAPIEENPEAFHRSVYIFISPKGTCFASLYNWHTSCHYELLLVACVPIITLITFFIANYHIIANSLLHNDRHAAAP